MASLPSNTFLCNYNARDYVAGSRTFPKTEGQTLDKNLILNNSNVTAHTDNGYCTIRDNEFILSYGNPSSNPFNRYNNDTGRSLTIVYKTSSFSGNLFANRGYRSGRSGDYYNYMVRDTVFHTSNGSFLQMSPSASPYIVYVRINADGTSERKCVTTNQIVTASSISYGNAPTSCAFFRGFGGTSLGEYYAGDFYWIYISTETLTDAEIKQVIAYNENISFETDITAITATYSSTTSSVTLTAEEDMAWTASTSNDWITLSTTGGTGSSVFTVTLAKNKAYSARNGLVTLTNGEDIIEITVEQAKHPLLIPNENIYRADLEVVKGYRSGSTINKAYRSGELIYYKLNYSQPTPPGPDYSKMPLTFNIISGGTITWRATSTAYTKEIYYSVNDGPWVSITSTTAGVPISLNTGDIVKFQGDGAISTGQNATNRFRDSTIVFEVYGNIMSLIDSTGYTTATTAPDHLFRQLFAYQSGLTSAENLILPATTIGTNVYKEMFKDCTGLVTTPSELPATVLTESCYSGMFQGCTSLTTAPSILPATTVGYQSCRQMFSGCTSLTTAPELPATTLTDYCYYYMFNGCTSLNYIKCLATDISASNCTNGWVGVVSSSGTFVTPSSTNWTTGTSGIPSGWTRVDA